MILTGTVVEVHNSDGATTVDVGYQGQNKSGPHVTGSAVVALPTASIDGV